MVRFSMNVLRAFEAVGRCGSFSKAAAELRISQSAVSRHIATLELDLNCRLFDRTTRRCDLTVEGRALLDGISQGLDQIDGALAAARRKSTDNMLNVSVSPFLSVTWFTPRLLEFIQDNPTLNIKLTHSYDPPGFEDGDVEDGGIDAGINWSAKPNRPRIVAERVLPGDLIPVCSPAFADNNVDPDDPASLLNCRLFHEFRRSDWTDWFALNDVDGTHHQSQQISDAGALRKAAISGKGVSLLFKSLIGEDLDLGRLVTPFPTTVHAGEDYWLTYPIEYANRPALKRFLKWLRHQAALSG